MSIFPMKKRESIKTTMLEVGIKLIKQKGMQHITISEISKQTGIGKGTFYHFYKSKESFIYEVILYSKEKIYREINQTVEENGGINRKNFEKLFNMFSFAGENNIISLITVEDEKWLAKKLSLEYILNPSSEETILQSILENTIGIREDINYHVLANMMKIMAFAVENKEFLHQDVLDENIGLIVRQILDYIFEKEEG
ncbi:MAG: TetR/AcrR family transcriptional regulator [Velocimicrobium sp.]